MGKFLNLFYILTTGLFIISNLMHEIIITDGFQPLDLFLCFSILGVLLFTNDIYKIVNENS